MPHGPGAGGVGQVWRCQNGCVAPALDLADAQGVQWLYRIGSIRIRKASTALDVDVDDGGWLKLFANIPARSFATNDVAKSHCWALYQALREPVPSNQVS